MKAYFLCLFAGLTFSISFAQKSPVKFGEIPMADMTMTTYPQDSSAEAVILSDYGEAYINSNINTATLNFERHVRIKILKKEGLKYADASILLYHSGSTEEKVSNLKASTFNLENGKVVETKLSKDGIFKEKYNRYLNQQKFTLPNVKEGSVIEYSYKIVSEFFTNFPNWQFQKNIPTRHSEYWAIIPDFFFYEKYMQGYVSVTDYEIKNLQMTGYNAKGHHWIARNVPAFKEEPYMTCEDDYVSKINFALSHIQVPGQAVQEIMGSWSKLNSLLLEDDEFYGAINKSNYLKSKVDEITAGMTDPIQKITALHNYVKQNIEWDGYKDFYAGNFKKILEAKKGTSGDINLLLASMLEKAGFEIDMVMLSTRDHGFVRTSYPMTKQFNYVVCAVRLADKTILLDATEKYLPINVLPERCINGQGLVISKKNHGWVNLETKTKAKTVVTGDFQLSESGALTGKLNFMHDGYEANRMRKSYSAKGKEAYLKDFVGSRSWQLQKSHFENIEEIEKPSKESHELQIDEHTSVAGNTIYINPFIVGQMESNPFKLEKREYPVDFGNPIDRMYMCKITVPEGYTIDELPQSRVMMMPGNTAKYVYNVSSTGNVISITSNFQINRNIFSQDEYPNLREFYNQVVAKQAEQIVIKKK